MVESRDSSSRPSAFPRLRFALWKAHSNSLGRSFRNANRYLVVVGKTIRLD
jgi:hypothetical protein